MSKLFIHIYHFFRQRKTLFYASLVACIAVMGYFALQVRFEENVSRFLPDTKSAEKASRVFESLKIKDKIIVMFSAVDTVDLPEHEVFVESGAQLGQTLTGQLGETHIRDILFQVDANMIGEMTDFVYNHLPLFVTDADYQRFDSLMDERAIASVMQKNYANLLSPAGMALRSFIMRDPLSLGGNTLKHLQEFQLESNYEQIDGYIFSKDGTTAFMFISPTFGTGSTGDNEHLIKVLEEAIDKQNSENQLIRIAYFGGPSVAVYNARQIKKDTIVTTTVALVIIILFISMVFKRKRAIPLIITPALFGALFALCLIFFIKGTISAIAVGAGSVVFGIALSYSIHMLAHQNHVSSVEQLIKEIAYPLTVGSFTTIGAFAGLLFTSSDLLRDFGLFASLVLIGTTLFCLIYLPHFLKGQAHVKQGKALHFIERINSYAFEKNKWLVGALVVLTIVCFFASKRVGFNDNMMDLNYEPEHLKQAEDKLNATFNKTEKTILFVTVGKDMNEASSHYAATNRKLATLKEEGLITDYAAVQQFLVATEEQQKRLEKWENYWTPERKAFIRQAIEKEAGKYKFRKQAFDPFFNWLDSPFGMLDYRSDDKLVGNRLLTEWQTSTDSLTMLVSQVRLSDTAKDSVYQSFKEDPNIVVFDRAYFTNKWISAVNDDFYLILFVSSILVFFALWISYGRIELTLMSFMPMLVSWVIIIGVMGLLGIQFNIVNIILATFIFGIGDDFSIFIMDGLQSKYRTGQRLLNSHKTAICFSAFTMIVGMGALIFAKHPALQSIPVISIPGMVIVVLVSYTLQPVLFHFFIAGPASKGLPPYTLFGILRSAFMFLCFGIGCLFIGIIIFLLVFVPIKKPTKKRFVCFLINRSCRAIIALGTFAKKERINIPGEKFDKPGIIIANHQSFIDILVLLSLSPKVIMMTKRWVWRSPLFGFIIRYIDFYYTENGYELSAGLLQRKINEGYSIAIFPEGTRTYNGKMKRFHKGAFYLAEALKVDIIPVLLYGHSRISSKAQPFNLRKSTIAYKILPRILPDDLSWGVTYQERTKRISAHMREEYATLCMEMDTPENPYFYETLVQNYIYKGPVEEWYIRIKVKMEKNYRKFNELVPRRAKITDIGCGFGPLDYMLIMLSDEREVLGIDYDEDKIAVANHAWLRNKQINFVCADALNYDLPPSDIFILSDVLHYMNYEYQTGLLKKCASLLQPGGTIIVRDGNASDTRKHGLTRLTELWSTRIMKFNKTQEELCFTSTDQMRKMAESCGMQLKEIQNDKFTSNTIYLLTRK